MLFSICLNVKIPEVYGFLLLIFNFNGVNQLVGLI